MGIFRSSFLHTKPSNFASGPNRMTQGKIRRFCMEKTGPKNAHISAANCSKQLNFGDWGIFHHALSKYVIASHNFTNSIFMTSSLYHSIEVCYKGKYHEDANFGNKLSVRLIKGVRLIEVSLYSIIALRLQPC